jgi:molybdopterin synthase sulfur carrier subunit
MNIRILFHSYFRDLTGCSETDETVADGSTIRELLGQLHTRFPRLKDMARSTLVAVGVEYQGGDYVLNDGDEVSLFPPVQGG